ncbi:MAG: chitobiase/beta-hexosaminidase C-terminal domain-containing protein [Verrucomicrobiota bacterium]
MKTSGIIHSLALCAAAALLAVPSTRADITSTPTQLFGGYGSAYQSYNFPAVNNDLTEFGAIDWAYYGVTGGSIVKVNSKAGGSGLGLPTFSNPNRNGSLQNGTGGNVGTHFAYTDGGSPTSVTDLTAAGATCNRGGSLTYNNDPGPSFTISAPVGEQSKTLYVWLSAYKGVGTNAFNFSLWDGATQIGSTLRFNGAPGGDAGVAYIYAIQYGGGTTVSGNLDFKFQMTGGNQDDAKFTLNAAALGGTVSTPAFNPPSGVYTSAQDVTISTSTVGASIYYTTNGDTPTEISTLYTAPVNVASDMTLKAIAFKSGSAPSLLASAGYVVSPPSAACDILTFGLPGNPAVIDGTNITLAVANGFALATLSPVFTKSAYSTCNQTSGSPPSPDFSSGLIQHYIVTAQDGSTSKNYTVTVTVRDNDPPTLTNLATSAENGSLGDFNLTSIGVSDWVTFFKGGGNTQVTVANRKTGAASIANLVSSASEGGASLGGDTFSFSNGTPTASASVSSAGASIVTHGGSAFYSFTIDISNKSGTADIWYSISTAATGTLSVTDGYTTLTKIFSIDYTRRTAHDQIAFTGATGDVLTVTYSGYSQEWGGTLGLDAVAVAFAGDVLPPTGFGSWAATKGLSGGDAAFDADPDHDGIPNAIEFVIGGEPNPANANSNSASLLPVMQADGDKLVFIYTRTDESAYLNPSVEFSGNMQGAWTTAMDPGNATITEAPALPVNGSPAHTVTVTLPKNGATQLFARLKVVQPAP